MLENEENDDWKTKKIENRFNFPAAGFARRENFGTCVSIIYECSWRGKLNVFMHDCILTIILKIFLMFSSQFACHFINEKFQFYANFLDIYSLVYN